MANDQSFPVSIKPQDLQDPTLARLNRGFQYLWNFVKQVQTAQATPAIASFPLHFNSEGTPGQIAYNTIGDVFVCYAANMWLRVGTSGTSTTF